MLPNVVDSKLSLLVYEVTKPILEVTNVDDDFWHLNHTVESKNFLIFRKVLWNDGIEHYFVTSDVVCPCDNNMA